MTDSEKLDLILEKVSSLECEMQEVKQKVTKTDLTIENEIRVNIQRVAYIRSLLCSFGMIKEREKPTL